MAYLLWGVLNCDSPYRRLLLIPIFRSERHIQYTDHVAFALLDVLVVCCTSIVVVSLAGGRLVIATLSRDTCPCKKSEQKEWCVYRSMTDIWRELMLEDVISEVR